MKIPNGFRVFCLYGFALLCALQLSIAGAQEETQTEQEDIALEADSILGDDIVDEDEKMSLLVDTSTIADLDFLKTGDAPTSIDQLKAMQAHVASLYDRVRPAVVNIQSGSGQGSGVVVTSDGYILTAAHVISTPNRGALITFPDGSQARAQTLGLHRELDAGILRIYEVIPDVDDDAEEDADSTADESDVEQDDSTDTEESKNSEPGEQQNLDSDDAEMKQDADDESKDDEEKATETPQEDAQDSGDETESEKSDEVEEGSDSEKREQGNDSKEQESEDKSDDSTDPLEDDDSDDSEGDSESKSAEDDEESSEDLLEARRNARRDRFKVQDDLPSFPYLEIGNSADLNLGQWIIAVGHPGGLDLDRGLVLRVGRVNQLDEETIVTDCTLVGGDSGGPLIGMDGSVIGIHSRIGGRLRENYHVPSNEYINQWEELTKPMILDGTPDIGFVVRGSSCVIQRFSRRSLAARSGLKVNDRVIRIGEKEIYDKIQMDDAISTLKPYEVVEFEVQRKGKNMVLDVTIGESRSVNWSRR